jgi:arylsulfatase A-like enzyme
VNRNILEDTIILYTSDHGQTLFENQASWLHCNYTPQEATVPLILIGKNVPPVDPLYPASHSNILPTLLDLMGLPADQRIHPYAPSLFSGTMELRTNRFFFDGSLRLIEFPNPGEF